MTLLEYQSNGQRSGRVRPISGRVEVGLAYLVDFGSSGRFWVVGSSRFGVVGSSRFWVGGVEFEVVSGSSKSKRQNLIILVPVLNHNVQYSSKILNNPKRWWIQRLKLIMHKTKIYPRGHSVRKRMWTYNLLTKNECFSMFLSFYCFRKVNFFQHFLTFSDFENF